MRTTTRLSLALAAVLAACDSGGSQSAVTTPTLLPGQVDLAVQKTVDLPLPLEGAEVVYTLRVANAAAGADATGVSLTDLLPAGLTFVSDVAGAGAYDPGTGVWTIGDLAAGAETTLELRASVDAGTSGSTIENRATGLAADQQDPNPANDQSAVSIRVLAVVDLAVTKSVDLAAAAEGDTVVFTVGIAHAAGTATAGDVVVTDVLPSGLALVSSTPSRGTYVPASGRWSGFALAPGESATLEVTATVEPATGGTTLVNRAELTSLDQSDQDPSNDAAEASVAVANDTNLSITKVTSDPTPAEGDSILYTVSVLNEGPAFATNVEITDLLPAGVTYAFHSSSAGGYDAVTGVWSIPGLAVGGAPRTLEIAVDVDVGSGGTQVVNTAALTALDQTETDAGDDAASAVIDVDPSANLALTASVDDATAVRHQPVVLRIEIENRAGGLAATGVEIAAALPPGLSHASHVADAGSYDPAGGTWSIPAILQGERLALEVTAVVDAAGPAALDVTASVTQTDQPDPDPSDDTATVALSVVVDAVEIVTDVRGVPHVYAATDQGAYFGAGYATARARLSQMLWKRLLMRGRVAEFFGRGASDELLTSDRRARAYGWGRQADRTFALLDLETRSMLEAYADGVNAWMSSPGATLAPVFAAAGVPMEPWTGADCIAAWNELSRSFLQNEAAEAALLHEVEDLAQQLGGDLEAAVAQLAVPAVLDDAAAVVQQSDVPAAVQQAMADYAASLGGGGAPIVAADSEVHFSQVWAVAGAKSADGRALLVSDLRIPLNRPGALFEIHVRGETFEVRGAGPPGSLGLISASSPGVAWGVSSIALDQSDLFRITTDPVNEPGRYRLDGAFVPFLTEELETILVAGEAPVAGVFRETAFGPIVTPFVPDARAGEEYAARVVPFFQPERDASQGFLAMYRAGDVDELGDALGKLPFPSLNAVFADTTGRIGYWANGAVPTRSTVSPLSALAGLAALEGDDSANDWGGIVPHELMPWVLDPADDLLLSANHIPVGAWYPIPLGGRPQNSTGDTARSRRLRELLAGQTNFDGASMDAVRNDTVAPAARDITVLALHARDDLGATLGTRTNRALDELEPWVQAGASFEALHRGVLVAASIEEVFRELLASALIPIYGGGAGGTHAFLKLRTAELAQTGTAALTPDEIQWLDDTIEQAFATVELAYGGPANWLGAYVTDFLTVDFPAWSDPNGFEPLDPGDVLTVGPLTVARGRVLLAQASQAYVQRLSVGLEDGALSLLPLGQGEPASVHDADQQGLFESLALFPSPTTRSEVEALGAFGVEQLSY